MQDGRGPDAGSGPSPSPLSEPFASAAGPAGTTCAVDRPRTLLDLVAARVEAARLDPASLHDLPNVLILPFLLGDFSAASRGMLDPSREILAPTTLRGLAQDLLPISA